MRMPSLFGFFLLLPFVVGDLHLGKSERASNGSSIRDGVRISRFYRDGEFQRITTWPGFCAKETFVDWGEIDVTLREVWLEEEKRKLQLIYEGGILSDCFDEKIEQGSKDDVAEECRVKTPAQSWWEYDDEVIVQKERQDGVVAETPSTDSTLGDIDNWFVSADELRQRCFRIRNTVRNQVLARQKISRGKRGIQDLLFAPGTKWCGPTQLASSYNELGAFDQLDRCCRRHDYCRRSIPPMTQRYAFYNYMPITLSHCECDQRACGWNESKRRARRSRSGRGRGRRRRDLLLIPGTQWCGRGHRATKYTNLGGFGVADACCRRHDTTCPFFIPAFQSKYELFNWGVSTIMHCACDERFRTCLKMAGTSSANFVGKLFFNVVQTKCFVLKPQKACLRRSRWGNCEQHEYRKQAHLRANVPY